MIIDVNFLRLSKIMHGMQTYIYFMLDFEISISIMLIHVILLKRLIINPSNWDTIYVLNTYFCRSRMDLMCLNIVI